MRFFNSKVKMPKDAIWLVPGLRIKRWFALIVLGSVLAAIGITLLFKLEPIYFIVSTAKKIVLDADALTILSDNMQLLKDFPL